MAELTADGLVLMKVERMVDLSAAQSVALTAAALEFSMVAWLVEWLVAWLVARDGNSAAY